MSPTKAGTEAVERPQRSTPSSREHELAMAIATKQARAASATTEAGMFGTGPLQGQLQLKSHLTVRDDGEDWPQYIGRYEQELRDILTRHDALNAEFGLIRTPADKAAK